MSTVSRFWFVGLCASLMGCIVEETPAPPVPSGPRPSAVATPEPATTTPTSSPAAPPTPKLSDVGEAYQLAFSQDGSTLASYGDDGCVHVWDTKTGRHRQKIEALSVVGCQPTADGRRVTLLISRNMAIRERRVVEVETGKALATVTIDDFEPAPRQCVCSPDGTRLMAEGYGRCPIYAIDGEKPLIELPAVEKRTYTNLAWSADAKRVAAADDESKDASILVWDVESGAVLTRIASPEAVGRLAFSPDGGTLYAPEWNGLAAYALPSGERRKIEQAPVSRLGGFELAPNGRHLLVSVNVHGEWKVSIYGFADGQLVRELEKPTSWAFHPGGESLAVAAAGKIAFIKTATGEDLTPK